jgi:hypothetical protein
MQTPMDEPASPPPPPPPLLSTAPEPGRLTIFGWFCLVLLLGVTGYWGIGWLKKLVWPPRPTAVIASFRDDFQEGQPTNGWRYLWNAHGPIGTNQSYATLRWNGERYVADVSRFPGPAPAHYVRINRTGGHPGHGFGDGFKEGNEIARYAIVAFTPPAPGHYWIVKSRVSRNDGLMNGNIELRVFVNDHEVGPAVFCRSSEGLSFDRELGHLPAGATIYVAVGPNERDTNDSFGLEFAIAR